jgi:hypothetical protein
MSKPATGAIVEKRTARGTTYALRFRAYGQRRYVTLGTAAGGWTRTRAEDELQNVLADVRRGIWRPPAGRPKLRSSPTRRSTGSRASGSTPTEANGRRTPSWTTNGSCATTCCLSSPATGSCRSRSPRWTATAKPRWTRRRCRPSRSTRPSHASGRSSRSPSSTSSSRATRSGSTPADASSDRQGPTGTPRRRGSGRRAARRGTRTGRLSDIAHVGPLRPGCDPRLCRYA